MYDPVNKPEHYNMGSIECIDYIRQVLGLEGYIAYCRGNAIKYQHRAEYKGKYLEDMRKHNWYSQKAIEAIEELNASKDSTNT
jgi:hypothetical protein